MKLPISRNLQVGGFIAVCVVVLIVLIVSAGKSPVEALATLWNGAFGRPAAVRETVKDTVPLLAAAAGVFLALRAGLFNIGIEGQFLVGAFASAAVALSVQGVVGLGLGLIAGVVAGALWALPAGLIKAYKGGHEVITTIMLNYVALFLTDALVSGPFRDPNQGSPSTRLLPISERLPFFGDSRGFNVSIAVFAVTALVIGIHFWLRNRVSGYEVSAVGANPTAAEFAGVRVPDTIWRVMVVSGAIGGFGGALQCLAYEGRFYQGFSPGYGFDSLGIAILAGPTAWLLLPLGLVFGALANGGQALGLFGLPKGIITVVVGLLILIAAVIRYRQEANRD